MSTARLSTLLVAFGVGISAVPTARGQIQPQPGLSRELAVARHTLATTAIKNALAYVERSREETVREWLSLCNAYGS